MIASQKIISSELLGGGDSDDYGFCFYQRGGWNYLLKDSSGGVLALDQCKKFFIKNERIALGKNIFHVFYIMNPEKGQAKGEFSVYKCNQNEKECRNILFSILYLNKIILKNEGNSILVFNEEYQSLKSSLILKLEIESN